jgi:hypothetical protein
MVNRGIIIDICTEFSYVLDWLEKYREGTVVEDNYQVVCKNPTAPILNGL